MGSGVVWELGWDWWVDSATAVGPGTISIWCLGWAWVVELGLDLGTVKAWAGVLGSVIWGILLFNPRRRRRRRDLMGTNGFSSTRLIDDSCNFFFHFQSNEWNNSGMFGSQNESGNGFESKFISDGVLAVF